MNKVQNWFGQVTTAHGVMILAPTILSGLTGAISWQTAAPLLVSGVIGLVWPEKAASPTAK